jgi:CIC family chloride channel protein
MASVAACVVGAPLATVFIVLELTLSYEFTLITLLAVVVSQVVSSNIFGHSFFDRQLMDRGIDLRFGRNQLSLNQTTVGGDATADYIATPTNGTAQEVMTKLRENAQTEAYCLTDEGDFVGRSQ